MSDLEESDCLMDLPEPVCFKEVMSWLEDAPESLCAVAVQAQVREILAARFRAVGLDDAAHEVEAEEQAIWSALRPLMAAAMGAALLPGPVHC